MDVDQSMGFSLCGNYRRKRERTALQSLFSFYFYKSIDTVNRQLLFSLLKKIGYTQKFIRLIQLHPQMLRRVHQTVRLKQRYQIGCRNWLLEN